MKRLGAPIRLECLLFLAVLLPASARAGLCTGLFIGPQLTTCTVSSAGTYEIGAYGADGGSGASQKQVHPGAKGAAVAGLFSLLPGTYMVLAGGKGGDATAAGGGGGGGGGSFVYQLHADGADQVLNLLLAAGGGGGSGSYSPTYAAFTFGGAGLGLTPSAGKGGPAYDAQYQGGAGGSNGTGGAAGSVDGRGAGGGGVTGDGGSVSDGAGGGRSLVNGGLGGGGGIPGGLGGGGAGANRLGTSGGGGGGYSGGGGGGVAQILLPFFQFGLAYGGGGGGSSYMAPNASVRWNIAGGNKVESGNGAVFFTRITDSQGEIDAPPAVLDVPEPSGLIPLVPALAALVRFRSRSRKR